MNKIEKNESYYFQLKDFAIHKKFILESGLILIDYLNKKDEDKLAFGLLKRLSIHDNSKIEDEEFYMLCQIPYNTTSFTNANSGLNDITKKSIELHWKHNSHHPEYFKNVEDMSELDIMEMCCDWHARSQQYKTDFLSFVKTRQENRFHFPEKMFKKIWNYCLILENKENL